MEMGVSWRSSSVERDTFTKFIFVVDELLSWIEYRSLSIKRSISGLWVDLRELSSNVRCICIIGLFLYALDITDIDPVTGRRTKHQGTHTTQIQRSALLLGIDRGSRTDGIRANVWFALSVGRSRLNFPAARGHQVIVMGHRTMSSVCNRFGYRDWRHHSCNSINASQTMNDRREEQWPVASHKAFLFYRRAQSSVHWNGKKWYWIGTVLNAKMIFEKHIQARYQFPDRTGSLRNISGWIAATVYVTSKDDHDIFFIIHSGLLTWNDEISWWVRDPDMRAQMNTWKRSRYDAGRRKPTFPSEILSWVESSRGWSPSCSRHSHTINLRCWNFCRDATVPSIDYWARSCDVFKTLHIRTPRFSWPSISLQRKAPPKRTQRDMQLWLSR